jgi:phosphonatase-like hydrolase
MNATRDGLQAVTLVVCDMAGTAVQDTGEVARAFAATMAGFGIETSVQEIDAVRGASKREAIRRLLESRRGRTTAEHVETVYAAFKRELERVFMRAARPIPGAEDAFDRLAARGVRLALNTGFDRDTTVLLVDALGWRSRAAAIVCGDDVAQGRPAPYMIFRAMEATGTVSVDHVLNVGDTVSDLRAAKNAGVRASVAVLSGAHSRAQLEREPHWKLIASIAELPALWD